MSPKHLAACVTLFVACASHPVAAPSSRSMSGISENKSPLPTVDEPAHPDSAVFAMLALVARDRQLSILRPVPSLTLDRATLLQRLRARVEEEVPPAAMADEGILDMLFGFVPPAFDYQRAMYDLLGSELAGYYEPKTATMLLADDLGPEAQSATLAHELAHALQDQHFNLQNHLHYHQGQSDAQTAFQCLGEGDATSAMIDVALAPNGPSGGLSGIVEAAFVRQIRESLATPDGAPRFMREALIAPYVEGLRFVNSLRHQGGWGAVDRAWKRVPKSSEQVLHVTKWDVDEAPETVPTPTASALGRGWTLSEVDVLGELSVRLAFGEWMGPAEAARAASDWGGDSIALYRKDDAAAAVWRIRYDDVPSSATQGAEQALSMLEKGMARALGSPTRIEDGLCFESQGRARVGVAQRGRDLILVAGPARMTDMSALGDCRLVGSWLKEVTAASRGDAQINATAPPT